MLEEAEVLVGAVAVAGAGVEDVEGGIEEKGEIEIVAGEEGAVFGVCFGFLGRFGRFWRRIRWKHCYVEWIVL